MNRQPSTTPAARVELARLSRERVVSANKALLKIQELDRAGELNESRRVVNAALGRLQAVASIGATVVSLHTSGSHGSEGPTDADFLKAARGLWGAIPPCYRDTPELVDTESVLAYLSASWPRRRRTLNP